MKKILIIGVCGLIVFCFGCGNTQADSIKEKAVISGNDTEIKDTMEKIMPETIQKEETEEAIPETAYKEKTEKVTPETIYKEAIELQSQEKWQEAALLFGALGVYEDSVERYKECTYSQAVQYFDLEQYVNAFELFSSIDKFDKTVEFLRSISDEEKNKIIDEVATLYSEKEYESVYMVLSELLLDNEKDNNEIYLFSEFMKNIQGEYLWWKDQDGEVYITKDVLRKNDTEYIIEPYCVYDESGECTVEAMLDGDNKHRMLFVRDGEIWIIYEDISKNWEVWESPEVFEASQKLREEYKEREKAKSDAQAQRTEMAKKAPAIGMTHDEVRYGAWGEPKDINEMTFEWGTTEQWCYSGYRYVYFTNGIVDAIQE